MNKQTCQQRFADNLAFFQKPNSGVSPKHLVSLRCTEERRKPERPAPKELLYKSNTVSAKDKNPARPQGRLSLSTSRAGSFPASTNRDSG
ncbi:MAG: hypothetical protein ACLSHC_14620 [Bilophila wadsworthia]